MGTLSTLAKQTALDAATALLTHLGLFAVTVIAGTTGTASTNVFSKTSHGMADGTPVILTAMTGGAGLTAGTADNADGNGKVYFVVSSAADTFKLSATVGGAEVDFTTDISAVTVNKLVEVTGGDPAYARQTVTYDAAAGDPAVAAIPAAETFNVPAGTTTGAVGAFTALSGGTRHWIDGVVFETWAQQGTCDVSTAPITLGDS